MNQGLSRDQILAIAARKGVFFVSAHCRNATLRTKCNRLSREGLLRHDRNWKRHGEFGDYYQEDEQSPRVLTVGSGSISSDL